MISFAQRSVIWTLPWAALTLKCLLLSIPLNASPLPSERTEAEQAILHSLRILSANDLAPQERSRA